MDALAQSLALHPWAWLAVVGLGAYHGANPAMGWLLAVSNGLEARRTGAVFAALPSIALGHLLAMVAAWLPFALLGLLLQRLDEIRIAAGVALVVFGVYRLLSRRHPRYLARVGPSHLVLWSFLMATAHGAGLMLVPVVLGLCGGDAGHRAMAEIAGGTDLALLAAAIHTLAMLAVGGLIAWLVYRYLGLRLLGRAWFNLDLLWGLLLVGTGGVALGTTA